MAAGTLNPQFTSGWTNQQEFATKAFLDTDASGINQGTVTLADLVAGVRTSLGKADTAYQKPGAGIPSTDMTTAVTTSLGKADTAFQAADSLKYALLNEFLLDGSPAGVLRKNAFRWEGESDGAALTTQIMTSVALPLYAGDVVTNLTFVSGATGAGTPTNYWFALYSNDATPALLQQTADQTSTAWAASTAKTLALAAPVTITTTGVYYAAVMVKATTVPTLVSVSVRAEASAAMVAGQKVLAQTSGSTLTTTAPATIATPTAVGVCPLVIAT